MQLTGPVANEQAAAAYLLRMRERQRAMQSMSSADFIQSEMREHMWSKQIEVAEALDAHRHVAVHSAHGTGKSWLAARLIARWIACHPPGEAFALSTAPTFPQVRAILWRELNRAHKKGNLPGTMNQTEWRLGSQLVALGRKPSDYDEDAFQGIHDKYVLVVLDEACGIPEQLWTAADSIVTNDYSKILAIGNPDDPTSHFARVCQPGSGWKVIGISAFDSPNLSGEMIPPRLRGLLVSRTWVEERRVEWGEDDPRYIAKVGGEFPEDAENAVIMYSWVKICQRPIEYMDELPVELGFDVAAGGGDESVIAERRGMRAGRVWRYNIPDTMELTGRVVKIINETEASSIKIDKIGVGQGVYDRLKELKSSGKIGIEVHGVNVANKSQAPERYPRLRDEIWGMGRELSESGAWNLEAIDMEVVKQLIAPRWKPDSAGRMNVEKKKETIKRIGRSPDDADALLLAFYKPPVASLRIASL